MEYETLTKTCQCVTNCSVVSKFETLCGIRDAHLHKTKEFQYNSNAICSNCSTSYFNCIQEL